MLDRSSILVLATTGPDGPWTTPVGYDVDDDLTFTFLSMPETRHVRHLVQQPRVSLAIHSGEGDDGGNIGLQVAGTAHVVRGGGAGQWWQVAVTPAEVWVFDSREAGRQRRRVDLDAFRSGR